MKKSNTKQPFRVLSLQIDAFANRAFEGNPAAVCFLSHTLAPFIDAAVLQAIAFENNLSETAFLTPQNGSDASERNFSECSRFNLRWFTPSMEVPLCGHATLAAAAAIFACANNPAPCLYFETLSGELSVRRDTSSESSKLRLEMDLPLLLTQPATPVSQDFNLNSPLLAAVLGTEGSTRLDVEEIVYEPNLRYLVVLLQKEMTVTEFELLEPNIRAMHGAHTSGQLAGLVITAKCANIDTTSANISVSASSNDSEATESCEYDFLSRFFGPWAGIDEDPVTGSAHSILGPYWARRLGKKALTARQCSCRGGDLSLLVKEESKRVVVSGGALIVIRGEFLLYL